MSLYSWYLIALIAKDFGFAIEVLLSREFSLYNGFCCDGPTDPVSSRHDCLGLPLKALIARDSGAKDFGFAIEVLLSREFSLYNGFCCDGPTDPVSSRHDCLGLPLKALIARDSGAKDFGFEVQVLLQEEFDLEMECWTLPNDPASS